MRRSERRNDLQIWPRRDSNTGGSDLWSSTLPLDHGGAPMTRQAHFNARYVIVKDLYGSVNITTVIYSYVCLSNISNKLADIYLSVTVLWCGPKGPVKRSGLLEWPSIVRNWGDNSRWFCDFGIKISLHFLHYNNLQLLDSFYYGFDIFYTVIV